MSVIRLSESKYKEFISLQEYAFQFSSKDSRVDRMRTSWENSIKIGVIDDNGRLVSALMLRLYEVFLNGRKISLGGISNVASYPESRGDGNVTKLFKEAFSIMDEQGILLSYLDPFSHAFYNNYGFGLLFEERELSFSPICLKRINRPKIHKVTRVDWQDYKEDIIHVYNKRYHLSTGPLVREEWSLNEKISKIDQIHTALAINNKGIIEGYILYTFIKKDKNVLKVNELVTLNHDASDSLLRFIKSHGAQVDTIHLNTSLNNNFSYAFDEIPKNQRIITGMMGRIVNFENFLDSYPFTISKDQSFIIEVEDKKAAWNNYGYNLNFKADNAERVIEKVTLTKNTNTLSATIDVWTQILMGFYSARDAYEKGLLNGPKDEIDRFSNLLLQSFPEFYDYF